MFKSALKICSMLALAGLSLFQTGCTDGELVAGMAGATIGAAVISANQEPRYYPPPPPPRRYQRNCYREEYTSCGPYGCHTSYRNSCDGYRPMNSNNTIEFAHNDLTADAMAQRFDLNQAAAERFVSSLKVAATTGDEKALAEIGLDKQDVKDLSTFKMIGDESISRMSEALGMTGETTKVRAMLETLMQTSKAQFEELRRQQGIYGTSI